MASKSVLCVFIAIVCLLFITANAWTDYGHIMTAEIARRMLSSSRVNELNKLSGTFNPYFEGRDITKLPYLAIFMDVIKSDTNLFDAMHFVDYPYQVGGEFEAPQPSDVNALTALEKCARTLIFTSEKRTPRVWSKALSLLLLVHVIGDIHQPLHAVSLFSDDFLPPEGDRGGNSWTLDYTSEVDDFHYTQMHLLFDTVGGLWRASLPNPITDDFNSDINRLVDGIMSEYPAKDFQEELDNIKFNSLTEFTDLTTSWARQSFELAKTSYDTYAKDQKVDQQAIQWSRSMLKKRVALAGYRLAKVLERVNTQVKDEPDRNPVPALWRILAIAGIVAAIVALVAFVLAFRKYRDYKQLSALQQQDSSYLTLNQDQDQA